MIVRFVHHADPLEDTAFVQYVTEARVPVAGESVVSDGSDPEFPAGVYTVRHVTFNVGAHGPSLAVVDLRVVRLTPTRAS